MTILNTLKNKIFDIENAIDIMWGQFYTVQSYPWENTERSFPECAGRWALLRDNIEKLSGETFVELYNILLHHRNLNSYTVNEPHAALTKEFEENVAEIVRRYNEAITDCDAHRDWILRNRSAS